MKKREFDDFSFKAPSSQPSESELLLPNGMPTSEERQVRPSDIKFRHLPKQKPIMSVFDHEINHKISNISNELEQNIKRRLELQKKLTVIQGKQQKQKQRQIFLAYSGNQYKQTEEVAINFRVINDRADQIDHMLVPESQVRVLSPQHKVRQIQKMKQQLLEQSNSLPTSAKQNILIPIVQTLAAHKPKPLPVYTVPDQVKIQKLLRKITFPEMPEGNLQVLRREVQGLFAVHQPHSDIHYLLMLVYFHEGRYQKVRRHFQQVILFKVFNPNAYWVAAEAEFGLECHQLCLKMSEECMNKLGDRVVPRMVYLKARCYEQLGNYVNSIVCYNQLIKLKPKISEYYLQRGLLYHRVGYYKEAREDLVMFGVLRPDAEAVIKERILGESSEIRRKEYIALLAKLY